jgi:hypothetical protein
MIAYARLWECCQWPSPCYGGGDGDGDGDVVAGAAHEHLINDTLPVLPHRGFGIFPRPRRCGVRALLDLVQFVVCHA